MSQAEFRAKNKLFKEIRNATLRKQIMLLVAFRNPSNSQSKQQHIFWCVKAQSHIRNFVIQLIQKNKILTLAHTTICPKGTRGHRVSNICYRWGLELGRNCGSRHAAGLT